MIHNRLKTQDERLMVNLTGPAGPGTVPRCGLREMSVFHRLGAVYVSLLANMRVF